MYNNEEAAFADELGDQDFPDEEDLEGLDYQALAKQTSYDFDTVAKSPISSEGGNNALVEGLKLQGLSKTGQRTDSAIDDGNLDN